MLLSGCCSHYFRRLFCFCLLFILLLADAHIISYCSLQCFFVHSVSGCHLHCFCLFPHCHSYCFRSLLILYPVVHTVFSCSYCFWFFKLFLVVFTVSVLFLVVHIVSGCCSHCLRLCVLSVPFLVVHTVFGCSYCLCTVSGGCSQCFWLSVFFRVVHTVFGCSCCFWLFISGCLYCFWLFILFLFVHHF